MWFPSVLLSIESLRVTKGLVFESPSLVSERFEGVFPVCSHCGYSASFSTLRLLIFLPKVGGGVSGKEKGMLHSTLREIQSGGIMEGE